MKKLFISAGLLAAGLLLRLLCGISGFAEAFTDATNPVFVGTLGRLWGFLPFSAAEMLICLLIVLAIAWIVRGIVKAVRRDRAWKYIRSRLSVLLLIASVWFLLYEAAQDVPFSRPAFSERYDLARGSYTTEQLAETGEMLVSHIDALAGSVLRDADGIMTVSPDPEDRVRTAMENEAGVYPYLKGYYPPTKKVLNSWLLSYMGITGVYSAFTIEANVNREMTPYNIPFTMCHELSHLRGSMPEDECNFIAYLACKASADADIAYSGYLSGWVYAGNELYARDPEKWQAVASKLDRRADDDLNANTLFWEAHKGKVREAAESFNDSYLKSQGVENGIQSYDRAVDLIVTEYIRNGK
jgi:hypothetical protein